ncbi:HSP20-like chaperone [Corynespora cassiicola Philippines]|uniref:HSP20-like chaperone n=1 Tax=Corynespora cassiicola Philippines TaxID=1448308 RepID=A0A2T2NFA4_CORCC|nr:HSP20-like chaperone [Corynespora cassiicola Philippines]
MAFFLTPRFAPAYTQQCSPFGYYAPSRPSYSYRRATRPSVPSFAPFLSQVDSLLNELDNEVRREAQREAQREAHRLRQQRKRAWRATFEIGETEQGWKVNGELPGFEQDNISIEITDENTLKVVGNTQWTKQQENIQSEATLETQPSQTETQTVEDKMDGITLNETEEADIATSIHSDTESHKSYQATVEDDFEDLGAETSSLISSSSSTTASEAAEPKEPKGKERAVEEPTKTAVQPAPQSEVPVQQSQQPENEEEKFHGFFEKSFRFPERIDASNVRATMKDGVLSISVPRAPKHQIRHILIQ